MTDQPGKAAPTANEQAGNEQKDDRFAQLALLLELIPSTAREGFHGLHLHCRHWHHWLRSQPDGNVPLAGIGQLVAQHERPPLVISCFDYDVKRARKLRGIA